MQFEIEKGRECVSGSVMSIERDRQKTKEVKKKENIVIATPYQRCAIQPIYLPRRPQTNLLCRTVWSLLNYGLTFEVFSCFAENHQQKLYLRRIF